MKKITVIFMMLILSIALIGCAQNSETYDYTLNQIIESLSVTYAEGDSQTHVTQDITLPTTSTLDDRAVIVWSSGDENVVSNLGVVNRQEADTEVTLVYAVTYGQFSLTKSLKVNVVSSIVTITFNSNGGSIVSDLVANVGDTITAPTNPTKEGYTFSGWYLNGELYVIAEMPSSDIELVASWIADVINVSYELNGGMNNANNPTSISIEDSNLSLLDPTKDGYDFDGWYLDSEFTEGPYTEINYYNIFETGTLYAKWRLLAADLSYELDGGTNGDNPEDISISDGVVTLANATKEGYTFNGWFLDSDFAGTAVTEVSYNDFTNGFVLYAKWTINSYTISFESNGGTAVSPITADYKDYVTAPDAPTYDGYIFGGWYSDEALTTSYVFYKMQSSDITLYAKWTIDNGYVYDGYYEGAAGLYGDDLITFLNTLINTGFHGVDYGAARYDLDDTDEDPNNSSNLILLYLGTSVSGTWDGGVTWNREHVWPQSLLGVSAENSTVNAASDLQNLKPANPSVNSSRGNKWYSNTTSTYSYEPRDEVKGDIARILFYMDIMYPQLTLVELGVNEEPSVYEMGDLSTLIAWSQADPVDDFEMARNDMIESYQGNRNPFIDHPEFVDLIWGVSTTLLSTPSTNTINLSDMI